MPTEAVTVSIELDGDLLDKVRDAAAEDNMSLDEAVGAAVDLWLRYDPETGELDDPNQADGDEDDEDDDAA